MIKIFFLTWLVASNCFAVEEKKTIYKCSQYLQMKEMDKLINKSTKIVPEIQKQLNTIHLAITKRANEDYLRLSTGINTKQDIEEKRTLLKAITEYQQMSQRIVLSVKQLNTLKDQTKK